ncbi:hypothetical protein, partial [Blautia sp. AM29-29]|uniref:hypothetical protein n=1 Tax=Blautia sp. AM29-29 TaxID=2292975 RepID=UPI000FF5A6B9
TAKAVCYLSRCSYSTVYAEIKQVEKEIAKLEAKKAKADQKAAEEAKKSEAEAVVKKLLAGGMSADEILEKLK